MNHYTTRREFLQAVAGLSGLALTAGVLAAATNGPESSSPVDSLRKLPPLSFSTLGCPDWTFPAILDFATKNNYQGIEVRGIQRQMDLPQCPEFNSAEHIAATLRQMQDHRLKFVDLGSSCELHYTDPAVRKKNLDEGRRFIDLAHALGCPNVRVFPNRLPKDQDRDATIDLIIKGLLELGDHARGSGVTVLMESHGEVVQTELLHHIMQGAEHPNTGMVWDIYNMWSVTKEPPASVYARLKKYIRHSHIKDGKSSGGHLENGIVVDAKEDYLLLGKGESPIFEAIDLLSKGGYTGFYSFEWEKLWHPEIAEPELALADYPQAMQRHFQ